MEVFKMLAFASKNVYDINKEEYTMANTSVIYARIDSDLKDNAEGILSQLGISPSSAIQMLYSQIVLKKEFRLSCVFHQSFQR